MRAMPKHDNDEKCILEPHDHDVLSGRGHIINYHPGNEHFRKLVNKSKVPYVASSKLSKAAFAEKIVHEIRSQDPPGRFLKQNPRTKLWFDIGKKKALLKTRQALREGAPDLLKEASKGNDSDESFDTAEIKKESYNNFNLLSILTASSIHEEDFGDTTIKEASKGNDSNASFDTIEMEKEESYDNFNLIGILNAPTRSSTYGKSFRGLDQLVLESLETGNTKAIENNDLADLTDQRVAVASAERAVASVERLFNVYPPRLAKQQSEGSMIESLEPTPITPNNSTDYFNQSSRELMDVLNDEPTKSTTGARPGLERDASLRLEHIFSRENSNRDLSNKMDINNLSALSNMSLGDMSEVSNRRPSTMSNYMSLGDMTEASNLSEIFEDSMRFSDG